MRHAAIASLVLIWALELSAQNAAPRFVEESRFDVASVRPNRTPLGPGTLPSIQPITGGIAARNVPVFDLITFAYGINPVRVLNAPTWTLSDRFDVTGRAEGDASLAQSKAMLRTLLGDRFMLRAHREMRDLDLTFLVLARADGRLGPGLKRLGDVDCGPDGPPPLDAPVVRGAGSGPCRVRATAKGFSGEALSIAQVARFLGALGGQFGGIEDASVVDSTGLIGRYAVTFEFSPEDAAIARASGIPDGGGAADPGASAAAFRRAVETQLGLQRSARSMCWSSTLSNVRRQIEGEGHE